MRPVPATSSKEQRGQSYGYFPDGKATGTIIKAEEINGKIVGSVRDYLKNNTVHIGKLIVHPDLQRRGIETRLLLEMQRIYPDKRYELFTSTRSLHNIKIYQNLGNIIFKEEAVDNELIFIYLEKTSNTK